MDFIVGTAGHIDHGKTALVKALTGTDADRLPDEKRRGITIDLGFAEMSIRDTHFGFVDVPGHERFVKNMLAGASGMDIVLLVIAADEGVMPQTREHFDICRLLGIKAGLIALTKWDLVDDETLAIAKMDTAELIEGSFLQDGPVIEVSSRTGQGIEELRSRLVEIAAGIPPRSDGLVTRLPIDRSFTVKGFGTVVTGTLTSGSITSESALEVLPSGPIVRVRGMQTHGSSTDVAKTGQRTAVNLAGVDRSEVTRGMTLSEPNSIRPTQVLDSEVEVLRSAARSIRTRQRVRVHLGTAEFLARIQVLNDVGEVSAGDRGFVQIRLESPGVVVPGEKFIIRSYSPQTTIAGGVALDTSGTRHRPRDFKEVAAFLTTVKNALGTPGPLANAFIKKAEMDGMTIKELVASTGLRKAVIESAIESSKVIRAGTRYLDPEIFNEIAGWAKAAIERFHRSERLAKGMSREMLRETAFARLPDEVFDAVLSKIVDAGDVYVDGDLVSLRGPKTEVSPEELRFRDSLIAILESAGLAVPRIDEATSDACNSARISAADAAKLLKALVQSGEIIRASDEFYFSRGHIDQLMAALRTFADTTTDRFIDVPKFKELSGVSRKYAIPLLEYFDRAGVTRRAGEKRLITK
jgi:selenocysteine-specific elongation factor